MSVRKMILLFLALLVGIGTYMVFKSSAPPPAEQAQAPIKITEILAATHDLPTGAILKESDMKWVEWAATAPTSKLYVKGTTDMATLIGAVLREGLRGDEPFIAGRVVQPHEQGFLAAVLTPGMRAVSVTLTPSSGVSGFVFPGDRVDVILSHSFNRRDVPDFAERHITETVLRGVRVLALDQKSDNQSVEPKIAQTATLEVTPKQAERLALAVDLIGGAGGGSGHGSLTLTLCSLATEEAKTPVPGASLPTWDSDVSSAFPTINGEDGLLRRVQIMRGHDKTESIFEQHQ